MVIKIALEGTPEEVRVMALAIAAAQSNPDAVTRIAFGSECNGGMVIDTSVPETKVEPKAKAKAATKAKAKEEPKEEPKTETTPAADVVKDMTPAEARDKGIQMVQQHYATHPEIAAEMPALMTKYGVQMFVDVKDEDAHAFLADVRLLVNGNGC
ncbi:hypothetical protein [uncultured Cohaesibacter sp.]|uniref:hypothetical protein n=1 Tax=uncultured Cohaesibacter sp. TaxID=1002546 RepID=UPI0029C8DACF|nr:hypothetical protein [uncultured Cohaesibacter sp.]